METSPFTFMAILKEYPNHFFHPNVCKVRPPLQVDTSKTNAIPSWKCIMYIPNNRSFTRFQAHELMLLSYHPATWWDCNHNNNGLVSLFNFICVNTIVAPKTLFKTKPKWEDALVISLSLTSVTPCESSIVAPCSVLFRAN